MMTLAQMQMREPEYRAALVKHLKKTDESFRATEEIARGAPLRHPNGQEYVRHSRHYLWSDYWWCQDMAFDLLSEFFHLELEQTDAIAVGDDSENDNIAVWNSKVIREVLEQTIPEMVEAFDG